MFKSIENLNVRGYKKKKNIKKFKKTLHNLRKSITNYGNTQIMTTE